MKEGPSRIPPMTSATTRGWCTNRSSSPRSWLRVVVLEEFECACTNCMCVFVCVCVGGWVGVYMGLCACSVSARHGSRDHARLVHKPQQQPEKLAVCRA